MPIRGTEENPRPNGGFGRSGGRVDGGPDFESDASVLDQAAGIDDAELR